MSDFDHFQQNEVRQAIKDILYMYADLAHSYGGFGHNIDTGDFDAFKFLEADCEGIDSLSLPISCQLLKDGAMVKILCELYDTWCEHECFDSSQLDRHKLWLSDGRFWDYPEIEKLMRRLFNENPPMSAEWVDEAFQAFYSEYVQKHFLSLACPK